MWCVLFTPSRSKRNYGKVTEDVSPSWFISDIRSVAITKYEYIFFSFGGGLCPSKATKVQKWPFMGRLETLRFIEYFIKICEANQHFTPEALNLMRARSFIETGTEWLCSQLRRAVKVWSIQSIQACLSYITTKQNFYKTISEWQELYGYEARRQSIWSRAPVLGAMNQPKFKET